MKFSTVNNLAQSLQREFKPLRPDWTDEEAIYHLSYISENSRTRKQAAKLIYEAFCQNVEGSDYSEEVSLERFLNSV